MRIKREVITDSPVPDNQKPMKFFTAVFIGIGIFVLIVLAVSSLMFASYLWLGNKS